MLRRLLTFLTLSFFSLGLSASEAQSSELTLMGAQRQIESPFHAKRSFRFVEEDFDASAAEGSRSLHEVSSERMGMTCNLFTRGGFYPNNVYALSNIEFGEGNVRMTFETFKNIIFSKAYAYIDCTFFEVPAEPTKAPESVLVSDFIEFFNVLEPLENL